VRWTSVPPGAEALKVHAAGPTTLIVDQVSMPMRILLAATLAFAAIWFAALRPKPADEPAAPAAGTSVTQAPAAAAQAAAAADATSAAREAQTGEATAPATDSAVPAAPATAATPATAAGTAAAAPATAPQAPAAPALRPAVRRVLRDIESRKTVVLLFSGKGAEDRAARRAVDRADRHRGKVTVHVAPISRLADYEPVVRGLPVQNAPTVLVIDRDREVRSISGLTVTREVDETVSRALRAGR
jgi:hypothetical protein